MPSPKAALARARERRPLLDHLVRTVGRYQADTGDRLAAAVTFYWFLSLFPLLLLAVSVLGLVYDEPGKDLSAELAKVLPSTLARTLEEVVTTNKGATGVIGAAGLLLSGLGWIDALREAIRTIWHQNVLAGNLVVRKLVDVVALVGLFAVLVASIVFTAVVTAFTGTALDLLGADEESIAAQVTARGVGYVLAVAVDTMVFVYLFARLAKVATPVRRVLRGALFGAIGFEVLKVLGGLYVERTTSKGEATYGAFAVVIGLLLFLNLVSRLLLLTAAFVVTAPYDSDVAPSGTSSPEQARAAGMPEEYADHSPDDPPSIIADGAPTRLRSVIQGKTPSQDVDSAPRSWGARKAAEGAVGAAPVSDRSEVGSAPTSTASATGALVKEGSTTGPVVLPGEKAVRLAASVGVGAVAVVLLAVLAHVLGTVRRLLRRD